MTWCAPTDVQCIDIGIDIDADIDIEIDIYIERET